MYFFTKNVPRSNQWCVGAVIIQPINYKYDHSFLMSIMKDGTLQNKFKFVCLFNPSFSTATEGEVYLEELCSAGFKGKNN